MWYTFEPKRSPDWQPVLSELFDISLDPIKSTQMAAGALMFLRGDLEPAREAVARSYTGQLVWSTISDQLGLVTIDSPRSQGLVGYVKADGKSVRTIRPGISYARPILTHATMSSSTMPSRWGRNSSPKHRKNWGGQRDSNPQQQAPQAWTLPLSYSHRPALSLISQDAQVKPNPRPCRVLLRKKRMLTAEFRGAPAPDRPERIGRATCSVDGGGHALPLIGALPPNPSCFRTNFNQRHETMQDGQIVPLRRDPGFGPVPVYFWYFSELLLAPVWVLKSVQGFNIK